jgi:excisionase family DNA binding protein
MKNYANKENPQIEMLTIRQTAAKSGLPERMIRTLVREGKIPAVKAGNRNYLNYSRVMSDLSSYQGEMWQ